MAARFLYKGKKNPNCPLTSSNSILQGAFVEDVGREGGEGGVHAVLHLQPDWADPQHHQALKQRLGQACSRCLLAHHHWPQLAVVTNQDQL